MSKAILRVGYKEYVVDVDVAVKLHAVLADAEVYAAVWHGMKEGREAYTTYHVYKPKHEDRQEITIISDEHYRLAKMAGEPAKE